MITGAKEKPIHRFPIKDVTIQENLIIEKEVCHIERCFSKLLSD